MKIGDKLQRSGKPHDGRAPDYDDWSLNGDIIYGWFLGKIQFRHGVAKMQSYRLNAYQLTKHQF